MYGIYGDIINAAEKATESFDETAELLEYPEVQADKAYYLSVLSKYNALKSITDKLSALKSVLKDQREASGLLSDATSDEERDALYEELSSFKRKASELSAALADALGCKHIRERTYCRFKFTAAASELGAVFCSLIKEYLLARGAKIENEKSEYSSKGRLNGISFIVDGEDIIARLSPLTGAHKVFVCGAKSEELCFAVTPAEAPPTISEADLKISVFHSSGAGGQHINKVESAVRVTHIPTGLTVTCQDERSQLANKKRALENIKKRLQAAGERAEKSRAEADIRAQYNNKSTAISFDLEASTMTDARLNAFYKVAFPFADFPSYIDGLMALCK